MELLTQRDFTALLRFLQLNYVLRDLPEFRKHVITALPRLVRSEVTGYNEVDTRRWHDEYIVSPPDALDFPDSFELFNQHIREHPVLNHLARTQKAAVLKISDFVTHRQFASTGLYHDFFRLAGVKDQISIALAASPRTIVGLALNRGCPYNERERLLLKLVRPHLVQAYQNAIAVTRMRKDLEAVSRTLDQLSAAAIAVPPDGRAAAISPFALKLLRKYFDSRPRRRGLPETVWEWMRRQGVLMAPLQAAQPLVVSSNGSSLVIRMLFHDDQIVLILTEQPAPQLPDLSLNALSAAGLSPREAEVLAWVARGRTNSEVAQILKLSARTVQKHIEHIFQKFGVESRTAAAARAWEISGQAWPQQGD